MRFPLQCLALTVSLFAFVHGWGQTANKYVLSATYHVQNDSVFIATGQSQDVLGADGEDHTGYFPFQTSFLELPKTTEGDFQCYPNPTSDFVKIQCDDGVNLIQVFSSNGQLVLNESKNFAPDILLDVSFLSPGLYQLKLQLSDGTWYCQKLIKY